MTVGVGLTKIPWAYEDVGFDHSSGSCRPGLRAGDAETRYEQLARRVQERIERGTLRPGIAFRPSGSAVDTNA